MTRALRYARADTEAPPAAARVVLDHQQRHLRRRLLRLQSGEDVLADLPQAVALESGDRLVLEDGRQIEVVAAEEDLIEITAETSAALHQLCWHLGNRHLPTAIAEDRLFILPDRVIEDMLRGLGAHMRPARGAFSPVRGAYHAHAADHGHGHPQPHPA